jgi:hypothetical protein
MKTYLSLLLCAFCVFGSGCQVAVELTRNAIYEVGHRTSETVECARDRYLACQAWDQVRESCPGQAFSKDYAKGFKDGFSDYVFSGGTGDPPPTPPLCYWGVCYETPAGHQAIEDWYAGFRHGTAAAKASGDRDLVVLPLSTPPPGPPLPPPHPGEPPPLSGPPPGATPPAEEQALPPPRKVEPKPEARLPDPLEVVPMRELARVAAELPPEPVEVPPVRPAAAGACVPVEGIILKAAPER